MERKVPPPERVLPPPPPPPAPSGKGQPAEVVELPPGGGFKGQGKYGSLGLSLPLPDTIESSPETSRIPEPLPAYSEAEINQQFGHGPEAYFRIYAEGFWDGKDIWEVQKGTRVLWKGVPKGRNGGESTKVEFFSGLVHGWEDSNFITVS